MIVLFDDFKDNQFVAYSLLTNSIKNNKISHAYLIDGNNNECAFDFVMALVKFILCREHYTNYDKCGFCNKCKKIDSGNYPEVKVIYSDSLVIRKEELLELQSDFSRTSLEGNKRIYVIKDCDKMNQQASNSLLKFLEEPEEGIIAILLTNNVNKVLNTIVSRCQLVRLTKKLRDANESAIINFASYYCSSKKEIDNFLLDESNKNILISIIDFILYFEENGLDIIIYLKKMWYNNFLNREDNILAIFLMINFYFDVFKYMCNVKDYFFCDYIDDLEFVSSRNSLDVILSKLNLCIDAKKCLECNMNINLVIDNLIIGLGE